RAQERSEAEPVVEPRQRREVGGAAPQAVRRHAERQITADAGEAPCEEYRLAMLGESFAERARAADLEKRDALEAVIEIVERGEGLHEGRRGAMPDARHTRDVVGLVPGERQVVGEALRSDAEVALDVVIAELPAGAEVPQ